MESYYFKIYRKTENYNRRNTLAWFTTLFQFGPRCRRTRRRDLCVAANDLRSRQMRRVSSSDPIKSDPAAFWMTLTSLAEISHGWRRPSELLSVLLPITQQRRRRRRHVKLEWRRRSNRITLFHPRKLSPPLTENVRDLFVTQRKLMSILLATLDVQSGLTVWETFAKIQNQNKC